MNRAECKALRGKLQVILEALAEAGYDFEVGNATYGDTDATFKVTIREKGAPDRLEQDFKRYARSFGLEPSDYGREFAYAGETIKLVGIAPRSRKYPIIVERPDGKRYKFADELIRLYLNRKPAGGLTETPAP